MLSFKSEIADTALKGKVPKGIKSSISGKDEKGFVPLEENEMINWAEFVGIDRKPLDPPENSHVPKSEKLCAAYERGRQALTSAPPPKFESNTETSGRDFLSPGIAPTGWKIIIRETQELGAKIPAVTK